MADQHTAPPDANGPAVFVVLVLLAAFLVVVGALSDDGDTGRRGPADHLVRPLHPPLVLDPYIGGQPVQPGTVLEPTVLPDPPPLAGGGTRVFGRNRFLVAYYGTAETGALGVLGETEPDEMHRRVTRAARPFRHDGNRVQVVYELIVTIADRTPGPDGDFSHDIDPAHVLRYVAAARRHGALLLLDIQPGRSDFLTVARRWEWALREPGVGLALDPEWRVGPRERPAGVIGHVSAAEVNRTSRWLAGIVRRGALPEKLFVLHQFRTTMLEDVHRIVPRRGLAMVQHADGFGTRREKLATYAAIARPRQFTMGMKLFYDEDVHRFGAADVHRIRPRVRFVSYQ